MLSISRHGTLEGDQSSDALRTELLEKKGRRISKPEAGPCTLSPSAFQVVGSFVANHSMRRQILTGMGGSNLKRTASGTEITPNAGVS